MFDIKDNGTLRGAYALLMFMQNDISASAEKKAAVKNLAATIKREIRAYNNRPAPAARIIKDGGIDGYVELVRLPEELDHANKVDAADWFLANRYLEYFPTPYDCSGQKFTSRFKLFRRRGHWFAYHSVCIDV